MKRFLLVLAVLQVWNGADVQAMSKISRAALTQMPKHNVQIRKFHASRPAQGPVMASALYWITKSCCWAGVTVAGTAVVAGAVASAIPTGGASVGVPLAAAGGTAIGIGVGAVKMAAGTAMMAGTTTTAAGTIALATAGATATTVVAPLAVAGMVGGVGAAAAASPAAAAVIIPAAKMGTVALASGAAGGVGLVAGIEVASCNAFALGMLFPWF